jgi:uncharacterized protein YjiS (DUF1127 family)
MNIQPIDAALPRLPLARRARPAFGRRVAHWLAMRAVRASIAHLDDHMLRDIGLAGPERRR